MQAAKALGRAISLRPPKLKRGGFGRLAQRLRYNPLK
jgi:hypothetical protein